MKARQLEDHIRKRVTLGSLTLDGEGTPAEFDGGSDGKASKERIRDLSRLDQASAHGDRFKDLMAFRSLARGGPSIGEWSLEQVLALVNARLFFAIVDTVQSVDSSTALQDGTGRYKLPVGLHFLRDILRMGWHIPLFGLINLENMVLQVNDQGGVGTAGVPAALVASGVGRFVVRLYMPLRSHGTWCGGASLACAQELRARVKRAS